MCPGQEVASAHHVAIQGVPKATEIGLDDGPVWEDLGTGLTGGGGPACLERGDGPLVGLELGEQSLREPAAAIAAVTFFIRAEARSIWRSRSRSSPSAPRTT